MATPIKRNWQEKTLDTDNETWDRENPNPIEGKFLGVEEGVGPNKSKMYTLETDDGEVKIWGSTVLDDKLLGVPVGTYVKIEYNGKQTSKKGTQYHDYKVFIDLDSLSQDNADFTVARLKTDDEPPLTDDDIPNFDD